MDTEQIDDTKAFVEVSLTYLSDTGEQPISYLGEPGEPLRSTGRLREYPVNILDARKLAQSPNVEQNGFELVKSHTTVADFFDEDQVKNVYDAELEQLIKERFSANRAHVFDHTIRTSRASFHERAREPIRVIHNDFTAKSARDRIGKLFPKEEADELAGRRFLLIVVWRPLTPVEMFPLAMLDGTSIVKSDLVTNYVVHRGNIGETQRLLHNPQHRWYYFPKMQVGECLIIRYYDSAEGELVSSTPHTSFEDPTTRSAARERQSIESRVFAFFND